MTMIYLRLGHLDFQLPIQNSEEPQTAFSAIYRNIASRRGKKRALVAVGHQLLIEVYSRLVAN